MTKPGHEAPLRDNQSEENLFSSLPVPEAPEPGVLQFESLLPPDVKKKGHADTEERHNRVDKYDDQGMWTDEQAREKAGVILADDIEKQETAGSRSKAKSSSRPKIDRRHLSPKEKRIADQAPPHVVKELRGET